MDRPVLRAVDPRWSGQLVVVAAPGPSLTKDVADRCHGQRVIAVQDAWRLMPWADVLYGCDVRWWDVHRGCPEFCGEKWSTHDDRTNNKADAAAKYGLRLVAGKAGNVFSTDPECISYGGNSGFQAINLAILFGASTIVLVGFDMHGSHFFGQHPAPLRNADPRRFLPAFREAARRLPDGVKIINATPGSSLTCFPMVGLDAALSDTAGYRPARSLAAAG